MNRAFNELSMIRKTAEDIGIKKDEYERLLDVFAVVGKIRAIYLDDLQKQKQDESQLYA